MRGVCSAALGLRLDTLTHNKLGVTSLVDRWNALSYANAVSPLIASFSLSLALQEDSGQNVKYVFARTGAVSVGGSLGLLVLYLVYWANGSSFQNTVTKGSLFVVLLTCILSCMVYFFRPPIWTVRFKSVLIGGIALCLVGGDGYWSGSQPLPLLLAFILANMAIGLVTSYLVAHTVLPIRKSVVVRKEIERALGMLGVTAGTAVDTLQSVSGDLPTYQVPSVPVEVGSTLIKCRVMIMASTHMEHRLWSCSWQFPVAAHLKFIVLLRKYLSTYGTLLDVVRNSERMVVSQPGIKLLRVLAEEIEASMACFEAAFKGSGEFAPSTHNVRYRSLERAVSDVITYLSGMKNDKLLQETRGSSRAAIALLVCLGSLVEQMYPVAAGCFGEHMDDAIPQGCLRSESAMLTRTDTFPRHKVPSFKHHRSDIVSRTIRRLLRRLHLQPALLKAVLQAAIAITTATVLLVCTRSYRALGEHALWVLITVWVMSAQSTAGAVVLKAVNRVFGTAIAGALSYIVIYLVYLLNGCSYKNRALKYVFMTLIYPLPMAFLHRAMIRANPQWKYAFYVSKVTLSICTLATFGETNPNPSVPAWRLLAVLIGLGIEFAVKSLVFYRESSTSMRHRIQEILESLAMGGWQDARWRAVTANKVNDLDKLEDLVRFEDKISAVIHAPALFDRRLINAGTLPTLRRLLRLILNRVLSMMYLKTSLEALGSGVDLHVDSAVRQHLRSSHETLIPACLQQLGAVFGTGHLHSGHEDLVEGSDPFEALKNTIRDARSIVIKNQRERPNATADLPQLTWTCGLISIIDALAVAMEELRAFLRESETNLTR